ncbi:MAG: hypothetical protein CMH85_07145 [Novosphingobium sp.]|nr:hypothetical protein [Novosphingobium sp.]
MADRGIAFSDPMVRALLDRRKQQTRRLLSLRGHRTFSEFGPSDTPGYDWHFRRADGCWCDFHTADLPLPYAPGDRLYVLEAYYQFGHWEPVEGVLTKGGRQKWAFIGACQMVRFDEPGEYRKAMNREFPGVPCWYKRLGRFMPREFSRMFLVVTDVRVERVAAISEADARAEGLGDQELHGMEARGWFRDLWNSLHTAEGERWEDNPWVVAITFDVRRGNIDEVAG